LLLCRQCHAHALSPTHYPLGPNPILLVTENPSFALLPLGAILLGAALLIWGVPGVTFLGGLWRAALLWTAGRGAEFLMMMALPLEGWHGDRLDLLGQAAALLLVGTAVTLGLMRLVCWKARWRTVVKLALAISFCGYVVAAVISVLLFPQPWIILVTAF